MSQNPDSFLDVANSCLAQLGDYCGPNPWINVTPEPLETDILEAIKDTELELGFTLPARYREFLAACSGNLITNGFLVPWPSSRNIVAVNRQFQMSASELCFWHEEDGTAFSFPVLDGRADDKVRDEAGKVIATSFEAFIKKEFSRWLHNAKSHCNDRLRQLEALSQRLSKLN